MPAFRRLGGDANQSARSVMQLRARGAQVVSLEEGALDETRTLELWERQQPRERSARVREGMRRRAVYGHAMGRPPYGYHIGDDRRLEPVPAEADVVRYIVRMYVDEGLGIRRIAQRLNAEGYRTRRDGAWSMVTIRDLLHNRVYTGTYQRFGVSVPDNHEALISQADFQNVQAQMVARRTAPGSSARSQFLLAGLLWCGESGSRMIGVTRRQSWQLRGGGRPAAASIATTRARPAPTSPSATTTPVARTTSRMKSSATSAARAVRTPPRRSSSPAIPTPSSPRPPRRCRAPARACARSTDDSATRSTP